ncbi:MAG: VOC family protein [Myxococcota bacterium]
MTEDDRFASNRFRKGVPSLPVKDCVEAIRYYCDVLGFEKDFDDAILGREQTLFAGVSRGEFELTLNQHDPQDYRATVGCEVDDVDLLHQEYRARGVTILLEPQDEPWGERHMAIADLYGHEIHFSSRK